MKIIDKRVYTGKNIYSHKLCIRLTVDTENLYDTPTKDIEGFNEKLLAALPGLNTHKCSLGHGIAFCDRLSENTYLPHVLEHILIEMQNVLGFKDVKYGKTICVEKAIYHVVYQYEYDEAALACADIGILCINNLINNMNFNMKSALEEIEKKIAQTRLGPSTRGILSEANKRGMPVIRIGKDSILQIGYGIAQRRIEATLTSKTSCIGVDISCDKELTREVLRCANIPVTLGDVAEDILEVLSVSKKIGYPVVVKPINGCKGKGVSVDINRESEVIAAYNEACRINPKVLVEKYIEGNDYRILVVNDMVVAVTLRVPPYVIGDSNNTVMDLIEIENENTERGYDHEKPLTKIVVDDIMINYLKRKGISLAYIPENGEKVMLRFNANLSTGGIAKDCTDIIHPDNIEIAVQAANAVGLDIAGIDVCSKDISKSIRENGGAVLEVNAAPGIRMHMYPSYGKARNVAENIIDYLFSDNQKPIPIISVTGTNGKTTVTRMIAHILKGTGLCVGMTTTSGVFINGRLVLKGDTTGPDSAKMILMDKKVECAVLETARGGILRRGLGYDNANIGVVTNISEDHIGIDGVETIEDLINVKSLVVEAVNKDGYAVLNADDINVNELIKKVKCNAIYFSKNPESLIIKKHILDGGICVFLKDEFICFGCGEAIRPIANLNEIPSTLDGKLSYNIENAMAAASACIGLKIDVECIAKGLRTFILDNSQNPGRFNVYNMDNFKVIVDYGHNIGAYNAILQSLKIMDEKRLVGIIGVPGDRNDDSIRKLGEISGEGFDYVYIKEDMDKRGRESGEVAKLLEEGVVTSGMNKDCYKTILNEGDALSYAMDNAESGDVITVFYEDYDLILKTINNFKNKSVKIDIKENVV